MQPYALKNTESKIVEAYAPTNIALCKYWGKRDDTLNLPMTSSLSITLPTKGSHTQLRVIESANDSITLNGNLLDVNSDFVKRLVKFIDSFRQDKLHFDINIHSNIPIAAGLASSACGFASIVLAFNELLDWRLSMKELSILARKGSGSASRSLWNGFVKWNKGEKADGSDSYAEPVDKHWPDLCVGLLVFNQQKKPISSREAMRLTVETSALYQQWPQQVNEDLVKLIDAIERQDFNLLGQTAEANALAMHATMKDASPSIDYSLPETLAAMQKVNELRANGLPLYFTQDAGPNLKLLFLDSNADIIYQHFPDVEIIRCF